MMKKALLSLLALFLLVEEWLWDLSAAFGHWLFLRLRLEGLERRLAAASPPAAMAAMVLPVLLVAPVGRTDASAPAPPTGGLWR